jgi:hypothetical protein
VKRDFDGPVRADHRTERLRLERERGDAKRVSFVILPAISRWLSNKTTPSIDIMSRKAGMATIAQVLSFTLT